MQNKNTSLMPWRQKHPPVFPLLICILFSFCFCLFFSTSNSLLGPEIGSDNAMFLTMGTAIASGFAPYTEIFDHKGPLLFLIQTLPQLPGNGYHTHSVFLMEVFVLAASLYVLYRLCLRIDLNLFLPVLLLYMTLNCFIWDGGNLTEHYTALPTLIGLYLLYDAFDPLAPKTGNTLFLPALWVGILSMLCFLVRANNAATLCVMCAVSAGFLLFTRRFKDCFFCTAGFLLGMLSAMLPVLLWLHAFDALQEAFYASITHNILYSNTPGGSRISMLLFSDYGHIALLIAAISFFGAVSVWCSLRMPMLPTMIIAGTLTAGACAFISHKFYQHYLMLGIPLAAVSFALLLQTSPKRMTQILSLLCAVICIPCLILNGRNVNIRRQSNYLEMQTFSEDARALYEQVPIEERDRFMAYRVEPRWYVASGALPCMRFYFLQEILGEADPAVMDEIVHTFQTDPPLWLVIYYNRPFSPPYDSRITDIFQSRYEFVDAKGTYQLLHLIPENTLNSEVL